MYPCELCGDWVHSVCLPRRAQVSLDLCSCCVRSRRPHLHSILPVLVELQAQELHMEEAEHLQGMAEILTFRTYIGVLKTWYSNSKKTLNFVS